jgi:hypothetical protein
LSNKAGGGLDHAWRSHGDEQCAGVQRLIDSIQLERHLAEPADVRAYPTAAVASGNLGGRPIEIRVVKRSVAASVATALEKLSVHVDNVSRTRLLVKVVHVLGADEKAILQRVFKFR